MIYVACDNDDLKRVVTEAVNNGETDLNYINTSNIIDMTLLFDATDPHYIDISEWDTSNVTSMRGTFAYCKHFNADISGWDVRKVTDMRLMFFQCEEFDCDLSDWAWQINNNKKVSMAFAFSQCTTLNNLHKVPDWWHM